MKKFAITLSCILFLNTFFCLTCLAEQVMYNTKTKKYHSLNCQWAKKCTVNCIKIEKKQAVNKGGVPCKVCSGKY